MGIVHKYICDLCEKEICDMYSIVDADGVDTGEYSNELITHHIRIDKRIDKVICDACYKKFVKDFPDHETWA